MYLILRYQTFLIKQFFKNNFTFYFSGSENSIMKMQLENFKNAFQEYFKIEIPVPENWTTAFSERMWRICHKAKNQISSHSNSWLLYGFRWRTILLETIGQVYFNYLTQNSHRITEKRNKFTLFYKRYKKWEKLKKKYIFATFYF